MDTAHKVALDRYASLGEKSIKQVYKRVAKALAANQEEYKDFMAVLGTFVPGGRILAGAGLEGNRATLGNCFVLGVEDTRESIFSTLGRSMEILSKGGGVGYNFSNLRAKGTPLVSSRGVASGPCSFISVYDAAATTISQGGSRRAAQMAVLNADHPDVLDFISYKAEHPGAWQTFNVSVGITDPEAWETHAILKHMAKYAWASGDPGFINLYAHNKWNNTGYFEKIEATNPCGEIGLPNDGACFLGAIDLTQVLYQDHLEKWHVDWGVLKWVTKVAVVLLNRVIDANYFPTEESEGRARMSRRIGIGTMGLADALLKLHMRYDSQEARNLVGELYRTIRDAAYEESIELAIKEGPFPAFRDEYLDMPFIQTLEPKLKQDIYQYGIRNACLLAQAPTGSIALLNGVSAGVEPFYDAAYLVKDGLGERVWVHPLYESHMDWFSTAKTISVQDHILMQWVVQQYVDQSVSKTINMPQSATVEDVVKAYEFALTHDLKGMTVFRDGCIQGVMQSMVCTNCGSVLQAKDGCYECPNCGGGFCGI